MMKSTGDKKSMQLTTIKFICLVCMTVAPSN